VSEQRAYVRVYWSIIDDEKFAEVYDDDRSLAAWLRLLIAADQAWPSSAAVPASCRKASLDKLVRVGLVDLVAGHRFRIHGLDAERNGRAASARNAAAMRWQSGRNAGASDTRMPSRAELSRAEPSASRDGLRHITDGVSSTWEEATGRTVLASGSFAQDYLDDATMRHGSLAVIDAINAGRRTFDHIPSTQALAAKVRGILDPLPSGKEDDTAAREERERAAGARRVQATLAKVHGYGGHEAEANPRCDLCKGAVA